MKKKGFTLVELLAVIIILAVIALIATPLVLNVVDSAKKSSFESSAYGIIEAVKMNSLDGMLSGDSMEAVYDFPTTSVDIQGEQPKGGQASVNKQGKVAIAIHNEKWCALKDYDDAEITLVDYDGECTLGMEVTKPPVEDDLEENNVVYYSPVTVTNTDGFIVDVGGIILGYEGDETSITLPSSATLPQPTYSFLDEEACINFYKTEVDTTATDLTALVACRDGFKNSPDEMVSEGLVKEGNGYLKISNIEYYETGCMAYYKSLVSSAEEDDLMEVCATNFEPMANSDLMNLLEDSPSDFEMFYFEYGMLKGDIEIISHEGELTVDVKKVGSWSLSGESLTSVTIPNGIKSIGYKAFENNSLTNVTIPTSVTFIGGGAFNKNQFSEETAYIFGRKSDGSIDNTKLVSYAGTSKELTLPSTVKILDMYSLDNLDLTSITLSSSLTKVGTYGLSNNKLTTVTLPNSLTEIGEYGLAYNSLTSITIPSNVTKLGDSALYKYYYSNSSSNSNANLTTIVNQTGKAFDWTSITGSSTADQTFETGTITHSNGNITVTAE